jgi:hypothetical protein
MSLKQKQFNIVLQERDDLKLALEQAKYEASNLRDILEAYQEHIQSSRTEETNSSETVQLQEQLSVTSSRNAVLTSEIDAQKTENKSLREIMDAMREDLVLAQTREETINQEHDERLGLLAEQLESLKKNSKRARVDKRKAERKMEEFMQEVANLNEQVASQDAQLMAVTSEQSDQQAEILFKAKEQITKVKQELRAAESRERNVERLLENLEIQGMQREDLATQHAELYQLEAELNSVRQAEADEKTQQMARDADQRARDAEQRLAEESAGKVKAEHDRDAALQQLSIIQERFGIVDRSGKTYGYGTSSGASDVNDVVLDGGMRKRSDSMSSSSSSNLERRFKMIQEGNGDIRQSLLSYPGPLRPGDVHSLTGSEPDKASEGCCCVIS